MPEGCPSRVVMEEAGKKGGEADAAAAPETQGHRFLVNANTPHSSPWQPHPVHRYFTPLSQDSKQDGWAQLSLDCNRGDFFS